MQKRALNVFLLLLCYLFLISFVGAATINSVSLNATDSIFIGGVISFNVGSIKHQLILLNTNLNNQTALILVKSDPQKATIAVGQEMKFDLDEDNSTYELSVKLNSVTQNSAEFTIQTISEKIGGEATPAVEEEKKVTEKVTEIITGKASLWTYILAIAVLGAIAAAVIYILRKKKII